MARGRDTPIDYCRLCGAWGPLSFEHVPPRAAFNNRPVLHVAFERVLQGPVGGPFPGRSRPRGAGGYTLCAKCNSFTGRAYGPAFVAWAHAGMTILLAAGGRPSLFYPVRTQPLRVIKQIATMFFSANSPAFQIAQPELVRFVLNRRAKGLPPRYRFFLYFSADRFFRRFGVSASANLSGRVTVLSEVTFPPFGYVLTLDTPPPDRRLFEITHFSQHDYEDLRDVTLGACALPTVGAFPGDYRTTAEINATITGNQAAANEDTRPGFDGRGIEAVMAAMVDGTRKHSGGQW